MKIKLGWWRDRGGMEHKVDARLDDGDPYPFRSDDECWCDDGSYTGNSAITHERDLIEFLRPLEDLPPALNSAVKAAEDMVRRLERHHAALRNQANEALEIVTQAKRELERLEKECEVGK